ncbi:ABC-type cobalamin/Fe3+-siderophores transport system ATPase subunit/ABC-type enterobactin transport system permease subunit [Streptomyces calvus]
MSAPVVTAPPALRAVSRARVRHARRRLLIVLSLLVLVVAAFATTLMAGHTFYPASDVLRVITGEQVPGASFTVGTLRLPRAVLALTAGFSFGMAGVTFQTMLRNPLASPDIIGISAGASAAAAVAIVVFSLSETEVSVLAITAALAVALLVYVLAFRDGVAGTRLILIGIGISALLDSVTSYVLSRAGDWDLQAAMRWLTGSLNGTTWTETVPAVLAVLLLGPVLLFQGRNLSALSLGDDTASALGVRVERTPRHGHRRRRRTHRVRHRGGRTDRVRRVPLRPDRRPPHRYRRLPADPRRPGRLAARPRRRLHRPVRLRHPLPRGRRHRRPRRALPRPPDRPHQPGRRLTVTASHTLATDDLTLGYGDRTVIEGLDLTLAAGRITVIVGANACGKSTLLRSMSRLLVPRAGRVVLDGKEVHRTPAKELARTLGLLPQSPVTPDGITVLDLVGRGRHPHQRAFSRWTAQDDAAVAAALEATRTTELVERSVDELSGGQRQRVWIAMALAQQTDLLLLDEPTTFLDISHQIEVLDLLTDLNRSRGTTIVMVLHDLNLAARYADRLVALAAGRLHAAGTPEEVMTEETVRTVYGMDSRVIEDPVSGKPLVLPIGRHHATAGTGAEPVASSAPGQAGSR